MSFEPLLRGILNECGGALGIALMSADGIPIVQLSGRVETDANPLGDDIGTAGVEFARILGDIQKASDALNGGAMVETVVSLARFQLLFRNIGDDVVLILALTPDGNTGKARYLIRRSIVALRQHL